MLPVFCLMIVLNAFLFYVQCREIQSAGLENKQPDLKRGNFISGIHLIICIASLVFKVLNYHTAALLAAVLPVAIAGMVEVIFPLTAGMFKFRYKGSIFLNRRRKIIFD